MTKTRGGKYQYDYIPVARNAPAGNSELYNMERLTPV